MMYASPYCQELWKYKANLCVSVMINMTEERFVHVEMIGAPILETQTEIKDFASVRVIGRCDGNCRDRHPGGIQKMMHVSDRLHQAIIGTPGFSESVERKQK